jgi:hypothetical protein
VAGVDHTRLGAVIDPDGPALPNPQQAAALRNLIEGRTYAALGATIRLPDDPALAPGSGLARAKGVNGAFFSLIARLTDLLQAELRSGDCGEVAAVGCSNSPKVGRRALSSFRSRWSAFSPKRTHSPPRRHPDQAALSSPAPLRRDQRRRPLTSTRITAPHSAPTTPDTRPQRCCLNKGSMSGSCRRPWATQAWLSPSGTRTSPTDSREMRPTG